MFVGDINTTQTWKSTVDAGGKTAQRTFEKPLQAAVTEVTDSPGWTRELRYEAQWATLRTMSRACLFHGQNAFLTQAKDACTGQSLRKLGGRDLSPKSKLTRSCEDSLQMPEWLPTLIYVASTDFP
eukprot:gb/GECG01013334.1/.p1 GENE.gb/GECG01013334.1/~~gb/GECG01013334.1/.p1  ORF type:complete len:126 (+),score=4.01 gb/GECG01013334.1/:1-378(+)